MLIEKKSNGEIIKHSNDEFASEVERNNRTHLCWDCANGYPSKCPKIADLEKGTLEIYNFVKKGYQLIEDDYVYKFIVTDCENFEKPEQKSQDEQIFAKKEMKKAVNELIMTFYETNTVEEALEIRKKRRARGLIEKRMNREKGQKYL